MSSHIGVEPNKVAKKEEMYKLKMGSQVEHAVISMEMLSKMEKQRKTILYIQIKAKKKKKRKNVLLQWCLKGVASYHQAASVC